MATLFAEPPAPLHVSVYEEVLVIVPVDCEPLVAFVPLQAPARRAATWQCYRRSPSTQFQQWPYLSVLLTCD